MYWVKAPNWGHYGCKLLILTLSLQACANLNFLTKEPANTSLKALATMIPDRTSFFNAYRPFLENWNAVKGSSCQLPFTCIKSPSSNEGLPTAAFDSRRLIFMAPWQQTISSPECDVPTHFWLPMDGVVVAACRTYPIQSNGLLSMQPCEIFLTSKF